MGEALRLVVDARVLEDTDNDVLAAFCRAEHANLVGALTLYTGNRHLAEELAQDAIVRVIANWKKVSELDSPAAWAYRVAINLANSSLRRVLAQRRAMDRLRDLRAGDTPVADAASDLALRSAIAGLPDRQRTALVLRYFVDLPPKEIAEVMGCREGTVWALVHQAIAALRRTPGFERMEVTDD